jgi:hypothetical protein
MVVVAGWIEGAEISALPNGINGLGLPAVIAELRVIPLGIFVQIGAFAGSSGIAAIVEPKAANIQIFAVFH